MSTTLDELLGESPGMVAVRESVSRLVERRTDARRLPPVLMRGETGTGKGLLARALHRAGSRAAGPFVDVNCAAIPDTLLEAEMFGVERGAFTDARETKPGLFRTAHRGTLFLDEIGLLPIGLQAKLLSAIEEPAHPAPRAARAANPSTSGSSPPPTTTSPPPSRAGRFREDLYHRLSVITLWLPPLRERGDDVLQLAHHFLARACRGVRPALQACSRRDARAALLAYAWPGNARELANVMERVALLSDARAITAEHARLARPAAPGAAPAGPPCPATPWTAWSATASWRPCSETDWNVSRAAARLGISRNMLRYRLAKLRDQAAARRPPAAPPAESPDRRPARAPALVEDVAPPPAGVRWERRRLTLLYAMLASPPEEGALLEATPGAR